MLHTNIAFLFCGLGDSHWDVKELSVAAGKETKEHSPVVQSTLTKRQKNGFDYFSAKCPGRNCKFSPILRSKH